MLVPSIYDAQPMPQFELEQVGPDGFSGLVRARTPEEAIRHAATLAEKCTVTLVPEADVQGWQGVQVDGAPSGRVRPHQRMRFRRD
ncbi:MAG: hypothetical protein HKN04_02925 [Rhodothermaceae bacterium]|nr:hypothetical protein [Rhodothermaceae bacterium]